MKKLSIFLGLMIFPVITFAGGYGLITPIRIESAPVVIKTDVEVDVVKVVTPRVANVPVSRCQDFRYSRWFECDTKSEILANRAYFLRSERFSDSKRPTIRNRATRGFDLEREFDRQAAARNKLLRYINAYGQ